MFILKGLAVSEGLAKAKALILSVADLNTEKTLVDDIDSEKKRIDDAVSLSINQIETLKNESMDTLGSENAEIFDAHIMMLSDPDFAQQMKVLIDNEKTNAPYAASQAGKMMEEMFMAMDSEYMRARAADVCDITSRIIKNLNGIVDDVLDNISDDCIIIAHDLTPSETAKIGNKPVVGFATQIGGKTSHSAIMARSLGIPAVCGIGETVFNIKNNDILLLDGLSGDIIVNPDAGAIKAFDEKLAKYNDAKKLLEIYKNMEGSTRDGHKILIEGNIGSPADAKKVMDFGGEGVGLFRSEFLFMDRSDLPSEEEQFLAYKEATEICGDKPLIIRTLDIGGDKEVKPLGLEKEDNAFLGYRAIRICLNDTELFKTQLRALLRASHFGNIKIMFPMISCLEELLQAKAIIEDTKLKLKLKGIPFNEKIKLGIMIEIPAAAIISDVLARHCDFFSIGTNDLIQYSCAVDRMNEKISHLYNPYHIGVLKLIKMTAENGAKAGIEVGVCGETAGQNGFAPILVGLGITNLSMSAGSILRAKAQLSEKTLKECTEYANKILECETLEQVTKLLSLS